MTYLISFACYGCHLHGADAGSVDATHNVPGTPVLNEDSARAAKEERRMDQPAYHMDQIRRDAVLEAIQEVCGHRGWSLLTAHVRSNHVHTVVEAEAEPWARHGSTRWRWKPQHVSAAIQYVITEQGNTMSAFESDKP